MTSRRSFLRGLLALPALPAVAQLPADAPSYGGPIPGYGDGPLDLRYLTTRQVPCAIDIDLLIDGETVAGHVIRHVRTYGIKPL